MLIVLAHRHVMRKSVRQVIKLTTIGQMAIAIALPGFNDLDVR